MKLSIGSSRAADSGMLSRVPGLQCQPDNKELDALVRTGQVKETPISYVMVKYFTARFGIIYVENCDSYERTYYE